MPAFLFSQLRLEVLAHMRRRGYSLFNEANNPGATDMTFTKLILTSAVVGAMSGQIETLVKAGRLPLAKIPEAKARVADLEAWLDAKPDSYFPGAAAGNTEAYEAFEKEVCAEFAGRSNS